MTKSAVFCLLAGLMLGCSAQAPMNAPVAIAASPAAAEDASEPSRATTLAPGAQTGNNSLPALYLATPGPDAMLFTCEGGAFSPDDVPGSRTVVYCFGKASATSIANSTLRPVDLPFENLPFYRASDGSIVNSKTGQVVLKAGSTPSTPATPTPVSTASGTLVTGGTPIGGGPGTPIGGSTGTPIGIGGGTALLPTPGPTSTPH